MHEYQNESKDSAWILETKADQLLFNGDIDGAQSMLSELTHRFCDPDVFFRSNLKAFALPLYELAYHAPTEERIQAANDVYGLTASLIELELSTRNHFSNNDEEIGRRVGRLSELTLFGLLMRQGVEHSKDAVVPLPTSRHDDIDGVDFYLSPIGTGGVSGGWPLQIKTIATDKDREECARNNVILIDISELSPHTTDPNSEASLPMTLLRELHGLADDKDMRRLEMTTAKLQRIIAREKQHLMKKLVTALAHSRRQTTI